MGRPTLLPVGLHTDSLGTLQNNLLDWRRRHNRERLRRGRHQVLGRRPVPLVARVDEHGHADGVARVVVGVKREAGVLEEIQDRREILLPLAGVTDLELPRVAMVLRLRSSVLGVDSLRQLTVERLERLEAALDPVPAKGVVASNPRPLVVVVLRADRINAKVNGARATQALSARVVDFSSLAMLLRRRLVSPVHVLILEGDPSLAVDPPVVIFVGAARLQ